MALLKCPDCGSEVSDAAIACPRCGRPMRAVATPPPEKRTGCLTTGCLVVLALAVIGSLGNLIGGNKESRQVAPTPVVAPRIPYQVVQSWSIPNGGRGLVVV